MMDQFVTIELHGILTLCERESTGQLIKLRKLENSPRIKTIWDIIVYKPERTVVACAIHEHHVLGLLEQMINVHVPAEFTNKWRGVAMWREVPRGIAFK